MQYRKSFNAYVPVVLIVATGGRVEMEELDEGEIKWKKA